MLCCSFFTLQKIIIFSNQLGIEGIPLVYRERFIIMSILLKPQCPQEVAELLGIYLAPLPLLGQEITRGRKPTGVNKSLPQIKRRSEKVERTWWYSRKQDKVRSKKSRAGRFFSRRLGRLKRPSPLRNPPDRTTLLQELITRDKPAEAIFSSPESKIIQ